MNTLKRTQQAAHTNTQKTKSNMLIARSVNIPNDSHLLVLIRRFMKTGVLWLWVRASGDYADGRSTGTGTGTGTGTEVRWVRGRAYRWNRNGHTYRLRTGFQGKLYCDKYCTFCQHTHTHTHTHVHTHTHTHAHTCVHTWKRGKTSNRFSRALLKKL